MHAMLSSALNFVQEQIFGMKWLFDSIYFILELIGFNAKDQMTTIIHFFIYDTLKIIILLTILIFIISYIQSYFPPVRSKKILGKYKGIKANIISALLGTVTPFCSCSSIPLFIGFSSAKLPLGVTFSFLISSPLVDLGSLVLLTSIFGFKVGVIYVILGLILAVIGGTIIEKMHMDDQLEQIVVDSKFVDIQQVDLTKKDRVDYAITQAVQTLKKVFIYILIGVGIGALIHNVIPQEFILNILGQDNPFSVLIATFVGIPMYADIFGVLPIASALLDTGVGLGVVMAFMMSVTALSLPSIIMLKKAIKPKLLILFVSIVTVGIILIGYIFNMIHFMII